MSPEDRPHATPSTLYLSSLADLARLEFVDGWAEVDVPIGLLDALPLVGEGRPDTQRLESLVAKIRREGFGGGPRIVAQLDREGRWQVIDGGHRITAARRIAKEFWPNLFGAKVRVLPFVLRQPPPVS